LTNNTPLRTNGGSLSSRALIIPAALLILGACIVIAHPPTVESRLAMPEDDSPEACVARLLAAEQRGDVRAFLDCFAPSRRTKLETLWQGRSQSRIAAEVQSQSVGMVGRAVTEVTFPDPDHARLVLERIHKEHTLRQRIEFVRTDGHWQIADLSAPEHETPAIPYGTPVVTPR
jgi:hypothetical protein